MNQTRLVDRREFTAGAVLAALSGVVITISSGCGGGGYSSPSSPSAPAASGGSPDKVGSISDNHGHSAVVTGAELLAGNLVQLDIRGTADHTHTVMVTPGAVQAIKAGGPVLTDSTSTNAHTHTVTFNADSSQPPSRY
jgi:hypothetical protein